MRRSRGRVSSYIALQHDPQRDKLTVPVAYGFVMRLAHGLRRLAQTLVFDRSLCEPTRFLLQQNACSTGLTLLQ